MPDGVPVQEICKNLTRALALIDDPGKWREAGEFIEKAKQLLEPVSVHAKTSAAVEAWVQLEGIPPLLGRGTNDSDGSRESAKGRIQSAVAWLCDD